MQNIKQAKIINNQRTLNKGILPVVILWLSAFVIGITLWITVGEGLGEFKKFYIIPWVLLTAVVISAPNIYLIYKKQFSLYHPLVFAAFSYFVPAFILGGFFLSIGLSEPYFLSFVKDPQYNFPLSYVIVMIGYTGLSLGFFLSFGKILAEKVKTVLPVCNWKDENLYFPCLILLFFGTITTTFAYIVGVLGFQSVQEIGTYDGIIFLMTLFWLEASFMLWLLLFKRNKFDLLAFIIGGIILLVSILKSLYAGNRGSLLQVAIMMTLAYMLAGRKIKLKQGLTIAVLIFAAITIGMIYGTTFRNVKQSESRISIDQYTQKIFETFDTIGRKDNLKVIGDGFLSLGDRILETGSSLAVVVANYEDLKPYEESYGLDDNIWKDTVTAFIPRIIWEDKPVASDARRYSELYFDYGESSFAITPMGDLIRNYGIIGVLIGMALLGVILRFIYESLINNQKFSTWRLTLYYILLSSVSYEGFYGTIIPLMIKFGLIAVLGLIFVNFMIKKSNLSS